jgi:hypothetical protein
METQEETKMENKEECCLKKKKKRGMLLIGSFSGLCLAIFPRKPWELCSSKWAGHSSIN